MKKIIIPIVIGLLLVAGCQTTSVSDGYYEPSTNQVMRSFSNDTYIWEGLFFPTNRVMNVK